jgi:hypothetical protein
MSELFNRTTGKANVSRLAKRVWRKRGLAVLAAVLIANMFVMAVPPAKAAASITAIRITNVTVFAAANCAVGDHIVDHSVVVEGTPGGSGSFQMQTTLGGSGVPFVYNYTIPDAMLGVPISVTGAPGVNTWFNASGWTSLNGTATITVTVAGAGSAVLTVNCVTKAYSVQNFGGSGGLFYNPGDGRVDPRPGDRLAVYCNTAANPPSVDVWGVLNDSSGRRLFTFTFASLVAAGEKGITKKVEPLGTIFLRVDANNHFLASWTGGPAAATGVKDFAKSFTCDFAR